MTLERGWAQEGSEGRSGGGVATRVPSFPAGKGDVRSADDVRRSSTDSLIPAGDESTRLDATRRGAARLASARPTRRARHDASTFDNPPTSRRKQEVMSAPGLRQSCTS